MKEPTEEQIKRFWERCGISYEIDEDEWRVNLPDGDWYNFGHDIDINPTLKDIEPEIDLNNLFKYAVPKLPSSFHIEFYQGDTIHNLDKFWYCHLYTPSIMGDVAHINFYEHDENPALSLFWAISKAWGLEE